MQHELSPTIYRLVYNGPVSRMMYRKCLWTNARFARARNTGRTKFVSKQDMGVARTIFVDVGIEAEIIHGP